jgi:hypothetical protein
MKVMEVFSCLRMQVMKENNHSEALRTKKIVVDYWSCVSPMTSIDCMELSEMCLP